MAEAKAFRLHDEPIPNTPAEAVSEFKFKELVEEWRQVELPHRDLPTRIRYESYLQHFAFFSEMPVESITPMTIDAWIVHIKQPEYLIRFHSTRVEYKHEFSVLKSIFTY